MSSNSVLTQIFGSLEESQTIYGKLYIPHSVDTASIRFSLEVQTSYVKLEVHPWCFVVGKNYFGHKQLQPVFSEVSQVVRVHPHYVRKVWASQYSLPIRWSLVEEQGLKEELLDVSNRFSEEDWKFEKFSNAQISGNGDGIVYERCIENDGRIWIGKRAEQCVPIIFGEEHIHLSFIYARSMLVESGDFSPLAHTTQFFFRGFTNL